MTLWPRNRYFFLAAKSSELREREDDDDDKETGALDVIYTLRPVIRFLDIFGLFPCRLPDRDKRRRGMSHIWTLRLVYSFGVVSLLFGILVSHAIQYRTIVFEEAPCTNAACVLRQLNSFVYGFLTFFIACRSFVAFRRFASILTEWNRVIRMIKNCFQSTMDSVDVRDDEFYSLPRRRIVWFLSGYYGICLFEHALGEIYVAYHCVRIYGDRCDFFGYYWGVVSHRMELPIHSSIASFLVYVGSKYALVAWNMTDFLVMILGQCLIRNFDSFNRGLEEFVKEPKCSSQWKEVRKVHSKLCDVVQRIDSVLSPAVLASVSVVIFFICHQIFFHIYMATKSSNRVETLYGLLSCLQLIYRMTGVSLVGCILSAKAKAPLEILRRCDMDGSHLEIQRFWDQVVDSKVSITAIKLFALNRSFLLKVLGIVISYEMIFLSLDKN